MRRLPLKKISAFLPKELIQKATKLTDLNQTDALIAGLNELIAKYKRKKALNALGKVHIDLDLDVVRDRRRL